MARTYAGVLGSLAFFAVLARSVIHTVPAEAAIEQAIIGLMLFAVIGAVVGQLAGWIVDDSVRTRLAAEVAAAREGSKAVKGV
jgi:tetrahydromethanopterin S-methyltransferase subunit C